jgi:hypothetical protein
MLRRVQRRMQVVGISHANDYVKRLKETIKRLNSSSATFSSTSPVSFATPRRSSVFGAK